MELNTSLGNLGIQYSSPCLPASCPYRTIATLRPGTADSLVEVTFKCVWGSPAGGGVHWVPGA